MGIGKRRTRVPLLPSLVLLIEARQLFPSFLIPLAVGLLLVLPISTPDRFKALWDAAGVTSA
jgi:hypothetical protein